MVKPRKYTTKKEVYVVLKIYTSNKPFRRIREFNSKGQAYAFMKTLPWDKYCDFYYKVYPKDMVKYRT